MEDAGKVKKFKLYDGCRMVNLRPIFLIAFAAAAAAFLAYWFGHWALAGVAAITLCFVILVCVKKKRLKSVRFTIALGIALVVVFCGVVIRFCAERNHFDSVPAMEGKYTVTGTADEISVTDTGYKIVVKDVTFLSESEYVSSSFDLMLYVYGNGDFDSGARLRFAAEIQKIDFSSYGNINATYVIDGIGYRASVSAYDIENIGKEFHLFGAVRDRIRSVLFSSMGEDNARIAYAMLTGDSDIIDDGMLSEFRYGGVAHIFAVSGLHIGVVYGILRFILKKARAKVWVRLPVTAAVLVFYAGVCGFSPSAVRATVMCLALTVADTGGMKYDAVNSIALAALSVLLLNPVYFYSVGFRLSVCAAGGIIILGGTFSRFLFRFRFIPKKVSSAISVCLSAQLSTFPVLIDSFGYVSALGLFLNLLFVPVISAIYGVLFVSTVISCLMPWISAFLFHIPEVALSVALIPVLAFGWTLFLINGFSFGAAASVWYAFLFFLSDKINLRFHIRALFVSVLVLLLAVVMVLQNCSVAEVRIDVYSFYGTDLVLVEKGNSSVLILTGEIDGTYTERFFLKKGIKSLDAVILSCSAQDADAALSTVCSLVKTERAYISVAAGLCDSFHTVDVKMMSGTFSVGGMYFSFQKDEGVFLYAEETEVFVTGSAVREDYGADLLIADTKDGGLSNDGGAAEIYFEKTEGKLNVYDAGELRIGLKNGIISCRRDGIA